MNKETINIVWLKRDIRSQDHEPLFLAEKSDIPYLIIYLFEPSIIEYPDTSPRHLKFVYHSILTLNKILSTYNRGVEVFYEEAIPVFEYLSKSFAIKNIYSYRESGTQITWLRDKSVTAFCLKHGIVWQESQRDGILRGIKNRDNWRR